MCFSHSMSYYVYSYGKKFVFVDLVGFRASAPFFKSVKTNILNKSNHFRVFHSVRNAFNKTEGMFYDALYPQQ